MESKSCSPRYERNGWIKRAWARDTLTIERWFTLTTTVQLENACVVLMRRVVGWDASQPPDWVSAASCGRVATSCEERAHCEFEALAPGLVGSTAQASSEVRRVQPPVTDWDGQLSSDTWGLRIPLVVYEVWCSPIECDQARASWARLTGPERAATGVSDASVAYLGSTILVAPQRDHAFLAGASDLVVADSGADLEELSLISEVFDGHLTISRVATQLRTEAPRDLSVEERPKYLRVFSRGATFAAMNRPLAEGNVRAIALYPEDAHGVSGSDWRMTVVSRVGSCSVAVVGLVRGIGDSYLTGEPWRDRAPHLGFSAPARVVHLAPGQEPGVGFDILRSGGAPLDICDPYSDTSSLRALEPFLRGGRVLTSTKEAGRIDSAWAQQTQIQLRTTNILHDRFVIGPLRGFLIGCSLNGIGKKHSFITELDNTMRVQVSAAFEDLWSQAERLP